MSNFTFYHNVFNGICIFKSFNSHISIVVCSFFEFGTVAIWCIREWVKIAFSQNNAKQDNVLTLRDKGQVTTYLCWISFVMYLVY